MKIIGLTAEGFVLTATKTEVANLCGYYYSGMSSYMTPNVGADINVHAMFKHLYKLTQMKREIADYQAKLLEAAAMLDLPPSIVDAPADQT